MATYRITAPDGNEYDVEAPDSASEADVMAYAQSQYASVPGRKSAPAAPAPAAAPDDAIARYQAATAGASAPMAAPPAAAPAPAVAPARAGTGNPRAVDLTGRALVQGLAGIPDFLIKGVESFTGFLPGVGAFVPGSAQQRLATGRQGTKVTDLTPLVRERVSRGLTSLGVPQATTPGERVGSAALEGVTGGLLLPGASAVTALGGATGGAASQTAAEFGAPEWLQQAIGLGAGLVPGGARALAGRAPGNLQSTVNRVTEAGGQIRRSGASPSPVSDTLRALPGSGGKSTYAGDVKSINNRVAETIGAPKKADLTTRYPEARDRAGREFDDFAKNESLVLTQPLVNDLIALAQSTKQVGGPSSQAATTVLQALTEAAQTGKPVPNGTRVSGDLFKRLDTELGKIEGAGAAKSALRDQFKSTLPANRAAQWDDLMRRYGDLSSIERLASKYWAQGKEIPPQELLAATSGKSYGQQRRTATGNRGDLGTLATEGQYIREPRIGGREGVGLGLGAGASGALLGTKALPLYGAMALLGRAADTPLLSARQYRQLGMQTGVGGAAGANVDTTKRKEKKK